MMVQSYPLRGLLAEFVESMYFLSGKEMGTGVAFPRMHQVMIINLGSPFRTADVYGSRRPLRESCDGVWINGKQDEPFQLENDGITSMYAIGLKLGMVPYFAALPAKETNNLAVQAEDWGVGAKLRTSEIALLRERLMECPVAEGFLLIERYLLSLVQGCDISNLRKVQWLGRAMYTSPVEEMCRVLGVTRKRLRSEAQHYFGDAVKNIQGIIRLNRILAKIAESTIGVEAGGIGHSELRGGGGEGTEWPGAGGGEDEVGLLRAGWMQGGTGQRKPGSGKAGQVRAGETLSALHDYFDQSHFIRDFKARTGITPSQYRRLCREFPMIGQTPNFLPLTRETFLQFLSGPTY